MHLKKEICGFLNELFILYLFMSITANLTLYINNSLWFLLLISMLSILSINIIMLSLISLSVVILLFYISIILPIIIIWCSIISSSLLFINKLSWLLYFWCFIIIIQLYWYFISLFTEVPLLAFSNISYYIPYIYLYISLGIELEHYYFCFILFTSFYWFGGLSISYFTLSLYFGIIDSLSLLLFNCWFIVLIFLLFIISILISFLLFIN